MTANGRFPPLQLTTRGTKHTKEWPWHLFFVCFVAFVVGQAG